MKCSGALPEKRNEVFQPTALSFCSSPFLFWLRPAFDFSWDAPFALGQFSFFFPSSFFGFFFFFCRIRLGNDGSLGAGGVITFAQFEDSHAEGLQFSCWTAEKAWNGKFETSVNGASVLPGRLGVRSMPLNATARIGGFLVKL